MALSTKGVMSSSIPPEEAPTIVRNPTRSLWEAGLVGHKEAMFQVIERSSQAIYAWFRAQGNEPDLALTRTENFVMRLQTVDRPDAKQEEVGRLQDFLLRRLSDFAAGQYPGPENGSTAKKPLFDRAQAERRYLREASHTPEDVFARRWSLGALELTVDTLSEEFANDGKGAMLPHLRQFLAFSGGEELYIKIAEETGTSVSALHVMVFRFRQRYREILRRLVGDTVRSSDDVDSELTKLLVSAT
jgi:RNA polymerase sigma-70 factor (ECF subfamily)